MTANQEGARIHPDIILRRPDGLAIVVDSKMSLTHYLQHCDGGLDDEQSRKSILAASFTSPSKAT